MNKIEKGIPVPTSRRQGDSELGRLRAIISKMKRGDSFLWDGTRIDSPYLAAKDVGGTITMRKINGAGHRIWRTS